MAGLFAGGHRGLRGVGSRLPRPVLPEQHRPEDRVGCSPFLGCSPRPQPVSWPCIGSPSPTRPRPSPAPAVGRRWVAQPSIVLLRRSSPRGLPGGPPRTGAAACLGAGLGLVGVAVVLPGPWAMVERLTAPITTLLGRFVAVLGGLVDRGARLLACRLIAVPLTLLLFVFLVVIPWAFQRLTRNDPLWARRRPGSHWVKRTPVIELGTSAQWFRDPGPLSGGGPTPALRLIPTLAVFTVILLVAFGVLPAGDPTDRRPGDACSATTPPSWPKPATSDDDTAAAEMERQPWFEKAGTRPTATSAASPRSTSGSGSSTRIMRPATSPTARVCAGSGRRRPSRAGAGCECGRSAGRPCSGWASATSTPFPPRSPAWRPRTGSPSTSPTSQSPVTSSGWSCGGCSWPSPRVGPSPTW